MVVVLTAGFTVPPKVSRKDPSSNNRGNRQTPNASIRKADIKAHLVRLGLGRYLLIADVPGGVGAPRYRDTQMSTQYTLFELIGDCKAFQVLYIVDHNIIAITLLTTVIPVAVSTLLQAHARTYIRRHFSFFCCAVEQG